MFSNIGSHALGLELADIETVAFVEIDAVRRRLLKHKFPGIERHGAIENFHAKRHSAEIIIGGPPCKGTSISAAIHGYRSGETLWDQMLRVGIELDAEWFVVEQPPGNRAWETEVARGLASNGYHASRVEFAAADLGAPHIRRRVFILAHRCLARSRLAWQTIPQEVSRIKRSATAGNPWMSPPPRTMRVANGSSTRLHQGYEWQDRKTAIRAIGDSNPPIMATVIGRAILASYQE